MRKFRLRRLMDLIEGVWRHNVSYKFGSLYPRSLMINLTYKCNSRCVMCNIWQIRPKNELSLEKWQEVMKDNIFSDIRFLTVSGGEAGLYENYAEAVKLFIDSMPRLRRLTLNTNGFLPARIEADVEEVAKHCQKRKVKLAVSVSIDGVGAVHDKIRRIKDGFKKSFETVQRITKMSKKYDISVNVGSLIMRQNVGDYDEMKKWMKDNNVGGGFQVVGFHETFLKNAETEGELSINGKVKKKFLEVLADIRDSKRWRDVTKYYWEDLINMYKNGAPRTTPCPFLKDDFVVDSLGDVYYCLSVRPIGNILKEGRTVKEIYFDPKNVAFRRNLPKTACKNCNSGCNVTNGIAFDAKRILWYKMTGKLWPGKTLDVG